MAKTKTKAIPERSQVKTADTWDLSSLFPDDEAWEKAFRKTNVEIDKNNSKTVVFEDLLVGKYAIIAIQDIDKDGKMSKNWIGFPREPFGTSNNPTFFGPPRYSKAEFELKSDQQLEVNLVSF